VKLSLSAGIAVLIERVKRRRELAALSASVTTYYDSMSDEEKREECAWGELGQEGLAAFEADEPTDPTLD
jgi:hypothetical protein